MVEDALTVLHNLLNSIPTFWGKGEITEVITLYVNSSNSRRQSMTSVTKILAQKLPPKMLLSTLCSIWPNLMTQMVRFSSLSHLGN
jgi:U3 small nucleolar RNA-associated protein 10